MSYDLPRAIELPRTGLGETLGLATGQAVKGLSGALSTYMAEKKEKKEQAQKEKKLEDFLSGPQGSSVPPEQQQLLRLWIKKLAPESVVNALSREQSQQKALEAKTLQQRQKTEADRAQNDAEAEATLQMLRDQGFNVPKKHTPGIKADKYFDIAKMGKETAAQGKEQKAKGLLTNVSSLKQLVPYTGATWVPGKSFLGGSLNREAVQKRAQFKTQAFALESFFRDMAAKGNMPLGIFNKLMEILPSDQLSERENMGRLDGIEAIIKEQFPEAVEAGARTVTVTTPDGRTFKNVPAEEAKKYVQHGAKIS